MTHITNYGFSAPLFTKLNLERVVATDRNARFDTRTHACKEFLKANSFIRHKSYYYDHVSMKRGWRLRHRIWNTIVHTWSYCSRTPVLWSVVIMMTNDLISLLNEPIMKLNHHCLLWRFANTEHNSYHRYPMYHSRLYNMMVTKGWKWKCSKMSIELESAGQLSNAMLCELLTISELNNCLWRVNYASINQQANETSMIAGKWRWLEVFQYWYLKAYGEKSRWNILGRCKKPSQIDDADAVFWVFKTYSKRQW